MIITTHPEATREELSNMLNKSDATVKRILASLKEKGFIKRVGSNKKGYWKILKEEK